MLNNNKLWAMPIFPFQITTTPGSGTLALNTATTYIAFSLLVRKAVTFNKFRFYSSGTGTVTVGVELQADNGSSSPSGTALDSGTITTYPTSGQWRECNNFTGYTLTPGATYWVVIKNTSATPESNYPTVTFNYGMMPPWVNTDAVQVRNFKKSTTDGTTWASGVATTAGVLFGFTNGTWMGVAATTGGYFYTSGVDRAYSGVEIGAVGLTPDFAYLNVIGIWGWIRRVLNPGDLQLKLYSGTSLIGQCIDVPEAQVNTGAAAISGFFPSNVLVPPKTIFRMTLTATAGDNASNYYYTSGQNCDTDYPDNMPSNLQETRGVGGVFTDTAGRVPAMALLLDGNQPFVAQPLNRRQFNSMR